MHRRGRDRAPDMMRHQDHMREMARDMGGAAKGMRRSLERMRERIHHP